MSLDLWNECQRCNESKSAPFGAEKCTVDIGGYRRDYYLCDECRAVLIAAVKRAMKEKPGRED